MKKILLFVVALYSLSFAKVENKALLFACSFEAVCVSVDSYLTYKAIHEWSFMKEGNELIIPLVGHRPSGQTMFFYTVGNIFVNSALSYVLSKAKIPYIEVVPSACFSASHITGIVNNYRILSRLEREGFYGMH